MILQLKNEVRAARAAALKTLWQTIFHPDQWIKEHRPILHDMVAGEKTQAALRGRITGGF